MSIKDLFGKKSGKILPLTDAESAGREIESAKLLEYQGIKVVEILSVVDREEGASENIKNAGFNYRSILSRRDLNE
jgi:orotate phosphoribosyltransferase